MECLQSTDASTEERGGEGTKVGRNAVGSCHHLSKPDSSTGEKKALVLKKCLLKKSSVAQLTVNMTKKLLAMKPVVDLGRKRLVGNLYVYAELTLILAGKTKHRKKTTTHTSRQL